METSKAKTYFGFLIRSRNLTLGMEGVSCAKKARLLVMDGNASSHTAEKIVGLQKKFACPLIVADDLEGLTGKACCKVAAVLQESLADALVGLAKEGKDGLRFPEEK